MSNPPRKSRCVLCAAPVVAEYAPFCSRGCKDRDLLKWLDGAYQLPGRPVALDDEGEPSLPDRD